MIYVYCNKPSTSASDLAKALNGHRLRLFDGLDFWRKGKRLVLKAGDVIIGWGSPFSEMDGIKTINEDVLKPLATMRRLAEKGLKLPRVYNQDPGDPRYLPRKVGNSFSQDVADPPKKPDYWVERLNLANEYRVHSFDSRSIGSGVRVKREGMENHSWLRTYEMGWRLEYDEFESTKELRTLAHKAVHAMGLVFGAVDIGETSDGIRYVLNVDASPVLGTEKMIQTYVKAINKWIEAGTKTKEDSNDTEEMKAYKFLKKKAMTPPWTDPFENLDRELGPPRPRERRPEPPSEEGRDGGSGPTPSVFFTSAPPSLPITSPAVTRVRKLANSLILERDQVVRQSNGVVRVSTSTTRKRPSLPSLDIETPRYEIVQESDPMPPPSNEWLDFIHTAQELLDESR